MANLKITLVKSLNGRLEKQIATAHSLGLRKIGQVTIQPDNTQTRGKIAKIGYLLQVTEVEEGGDKYEASRTCSCRWLHFRGQAQGPWRWFR